MAFPKTSHSAILGLHDRNAAVRRQSMESVIGAYWEPVRTYLRLRWRESLEDSADLTQAFFSKTIEAGTFTRYDPARGTFRTYLRTCLDRFVLNARRKVPAPSLPLDIDIASSDEPPEDVFHREWVRSLLTLAIDDLRASQDEVRFRVFERYDLNDSGDTPRYADLAAEFGVTTASITNYLAAMRRELRMAVLNRLRELTMTEREFRSEARAVLGIEV
jgi:RNA polymerase sigma factor (sigma-70 family)